MRNEILHEEKRQIAARWNRVGARWDIPVQRFLAPPAKRLVELARIQAGESVLDVGTGTAAIAIRAARCAGSVGRVVGIDISTAMLEQGRRNIDQAGLHNIELREGDAEHLDFPDGSFDATIWGLSLFLLPDPMAGLRESWRVLRPGGRIAVSIQGPTSLEPLLGMYFSRLRSYGIAAPDGPRWRRFDHPERCRDTLREAGFERIEVRAEQFGRYLSRAGDWWDLVGNVGFGGFLEALSPREQSQFKAEHLAEVEKLTSDKGIWLDLAVMFALGWKSPSPIIGGSPLHHVASPLGLPGGSG